MTAKLQLTEELWNGLWKHQQERQAQERERIRQAVAKSNVPLAPELVEALIRLPDEHSRAVLRERPGFALAERRSSYLTSLYIMELSLEDLLNASGGFYAFRPHQRPCAGSDQAPHSEGAFRYGKCCSFISGSLAAHAKKD